MEPSRGQKAALLTSRDCILIYPRAPVVVLVVVAVPGALIAVVAGGASATAPCDQRGVAEGVSQNTGSSHIATPRSTE